MSFNPCRHIFGPVPSRRLGLSLGVDLIPHKVCSFDCIYCECGRTTRCTIHREDFFPGDEVLRELFRALDEVDALDYITFSGSGEPTLCRGLETLVDAIKSEFPSRRIALLTNSSLLHIPEVRASLKKIDVVLPSLDAATNDAFQSINRPHPGLGVDMIIDGLARLRRELRNQIWLEILFVRGMNDSPAELRALRRAVSKINPDRVQLNTIDRPPASRNALPVSPDEMEVIRDALDLPGTEIIAAFSGHRPSVQILDEIPDTILEALKRRPLTLEDLRSITGKSAAELNKFLRVLEEKNAIRRETRERGVFYRVV